MFPPSLTFNVSQVHRLSLPEDRLERGGDHQVTGAGGPEEEDLVSGVSLTGSHQYILSALSALPGWSASLIPWLLGEIFTIP